MRKYDVDLLTSWFVLNVHLFIYFMYPFISFMCSIVCFTFNLFVVCVN